MCGFNVFFAAAACEAAGVQNGGCVISDLWCNLVKWVVANQVGLLLLAICVAVSIPLSIIISVIIRRILKAMLKRSKKDENKITASLNKPILFAGIFSGFVYGLRMISLPIGVMAFIHRAYYVVMVCTVAWALLRVLSVMKLLLQEIAKKTENVYDDLLVSLVYPVLKAVVWVLAIFFVAENLFQCGSKSFIIAYPDTIGVFEQVEKEPEIFELRTANNSAFEQCGFNEIMTFILTGKAFAHDNDIGDIHKFKHFSGGVSKETLNVGAAAVKVGGEGAFAQK